MFSRAVVRRAMVAVLTLLVVVVPFLSTSAAQGDEIGDLQSRAAEVSAQITDLQNQVVSDTAAVEQANYEASQIAQKIDQASAQLAEAKRSEERSRKQLADFALNAYVTGGTGSVDLATLLDTSAGKIGARQGYQSTAVGNRQDLVDQLEAAQQVTQDRAAALRFQHDRATEVADKARARRDEADRAQAKLQAIKSQLNGKLAQLVAERQAAAQKAEEAKAKAQAQAQAQAQAAAQQATTRAPASQVVTGSGGGSSSYSPPSVVTPIPAGSGNGGAAVAAAESQLGVTYVWGAESPGQGFDCSGLTQWAWSQAGVSIPRVTYGQADAGPSIPLSQIQPGDLVFYDGFGHVAMYVGGGTVIHAPHTGDVVRYASLYMSTPIKVVRPG